MMRTAVLASILKGHDSRTWFATSQSPITLDIRANSCASPASLGAPQHALQWLRPQICSRVQVFSLSHLLRESVRATCRCGFRFSLRRRSSSKVSTPARDSHWLERHSEGSVWMNHSGANHATSHAVKNVIPTLVPQCRAWHRRLSRGKKFQLKTQRHSPRFSR